MPYIKSYEVMRSLIWVKAIIHQKKWSQMAFVVYLKKKTQSMFDIFLI